MGIRCADHVTPLYPKNLALTSPTGGGRSVGIVRLRTKATGFFFLPARSYCKGMEVNKADKSLKLNLPGHRKVILKTVWSPLSMILQMSEKFKNFCPMYVN